MKKTYVKMLSVAASSFLVLASVSGCSFDTSFLNSEAKEEAVTKVLTETVKPAGNVSFSDEKFKEETVYVFTDACGTQKEIIVNEKLSNPDGAADIHDVTDLKDIINLSGEESYEVKADGIDWNASGNSITYQGKSNESAPVTIKTTYFLNGEKIEPQNLTGKSGKIKIRFDYTNNEKREVEVAGEKKEMYVPFTVVTGMLLDSANFSNIEVTNGKVTEVGDDSLAIGIVLPGMEESLSSKLDELNVTMDIPDCFEVTADVTDFKLDTVISVVTSSISTDIDVDDLDTKGLEEKIDELKDATDALSDGTDKIAEGTGELAEKIPELVNGAGDLENGANALKEGAGKIQGGVSAYTNGVDAAAAGANSIENGAHTIDGAVGQLNETMASTIVPGVSTLADGAASIESGIGQLVSGLSEGIAAGKENAKAQANAGLAAQEELTKLVGCTVTLDNIDAVIGQLQETENYLKNELLISDNEAAYKAIAQKVKAENPDMDDATLDAVVKMQITPQSNDEAEVMRAAETVKAAASGYRNAILENINKLEEVIASLKSVKAQVNGAQAALDQVSASLTEGESAQSIQALCDGAGSLTAGLNKLKAGIGTYDEKEIEACVSSGQNTVCSALYQIGRGTTTLENGTKELSGGLATLKSKSGELNNGVASLVSGLGSLAEGTTKIKDATVKLNDGVGELNAGAVKLNNGMIEFNDEAVSKIDKAFDDNSDNLIVELKTLMDLGKDYKSFAGKSDDYDGNVIFIYKMDGIGE